MQRVCKHHMLKCCLSDEGNMIKNINFNLSNWRNTALSFTLFEHSLHLLFSVMLSSTLTKKSLDVSAYFICHLAHLYLNKTCKLHFFPIPCCSYGTHVLSYANNFKFTFIGIKMCFKNVQWSFSGKKITINCSIPENNVSEKLIELKFRSR